MTTETPGSAGEGAVQAAPPSGLSRYDLGRSLGSGPSGEVFEALDHQLVRRVALKLARASPPISPEAARLAEREARAAAGLNHPNIAGLFDVGLDQGRPFIAMERTEGFPPVANADDPEAAIEILEKAARAVDAVHGLGILHLHLKPENILMTRSGEPKVSDFGTIHWMAAPAVTACTAPEQVAGATASPRTDVYALGAILYELAVGKPLFPGDNPDELRSKIEMSAPTPPRAANPKVTGDLETVILRAIEKTPEFRFATALEFAEELVRVRRRKPIWTRRMTAVRRIQRNVWHHRAIYAVLLLLLAAAAVGGRHLYKEAEEKAARAALEDLDAGAALIGQAAERRYGPAGDYAEVRALSSQGRAKIEPVLASRPGLAAGHHALGRAWELEGRDDLAEASLRKALELDPARVRARYDLGRLLARRSFLERVLSSAARMGPSGEQWRDETRRQLEQAVEGAAGLETPLDRDVAAAQLQLTKGDRDGVRTTALAKIGEYRGRRGEEEFHFLLAQATDGTLKLESLNRALELRPLDAVFLYYRGSVETGLKHWDRAVADFRAALALHPALQGAAVGLAVVLEVQGDLAGAIAELGKVLETNPDFIIGRCIRGRLLSELRRLPEAKADLDHVLTIRPGFRMALAYRGVVHNLAEQYDPALADLDDALRDSKDEQPAHLGFMRLHRGTVLARLGRFDAALQDLDEAIRLDPSNPNPRMMRSWALGSKPDPQFRMALADVDEAVRIAPASWPSRQWAAEWRAHLARNLETSK